MRHRAAIIRTKVLGAVEPGFERVRDTFAENFAVRGEWGAGLCVWHRGRVVVDLWGGLRNLPRDEPWREDTLATIFSATKGLVAMCMLVLAERGELDYDAPIASYWPEFARAGKEGITVRMLLNHRSGLVGLDRPISLDHLDGRAEGLEQALVEQQPRWQPGTEQGYHAITYGLYAQALFQRVRGESLGTFLAREIAGPLGADVHLGTGEDEQKRMATTYALRTREALRRVIPTLLFDRGVDGRVAREVLRRGDAARALTNPRALGPTGLRNFNLPRVRAMELPWANATASARGLCTLYAVLANGGELGGVRLVSRESVAPMRERQSWSDFDRVMRKPIGWTQGFLKEELGLFSPGRVAFGHAGAGGALGWCDPDEGLAIGYVPNRMAAAVRSERTRALCTAIYAAVGAL